MNQAPTCGLAFAAPSLRRVASLVLVDIAPNLTFSVVTIRPRADFLSATHPF